MTTHVFHRAAPVRRPHAALSLVEVAAMTALLLSYIWLWHGRFRGAYIVVVVLYFSLGIAGQWYRRESPRQIGFTLDNLKPALLDGLRVTLPIVGLAILVGALAGSMAYPSLKVWPLQLVGGWLWGTAQQYGLTAVLFRRLNEVFGNPSAAAAVAAALFSLFHLPNAFLMALTLCAGLLACWLYRREPNLLVLGAMHALISFVVIHSLPSSVTLRMHVGP